MLTAESVGGFSRGRHRKSNSGLMVPPGVRRQACIKRGDRLEFKVPGSVITIVPRLPGADDEYTPKQRRIIDAQLDEAEKGPFRGPFSTAEKTITDLNSQLQKRAALKRPKRSR